jgi:hypothetical protein
MASWKYILILMTLLTSCKCNTSSIPKEPKVISFDKIKWKQKDDQGYTYRDEMVNDLIKNRTLEGLKKADVINLLGNPDKIDQNVLTYEILEQKSYGFQFNKKIMVLYIEKDSTVGKATVLD